MGYWSYKGSNIEYRDKRHAPDLEGERNRHPKKKKKKKDKRANHKHEYVPAIYKHHYIDFKGKPRETEAYGDHCKICGRVRNYRYGSYSSTWNSIEHFKEEYPNYVVVELPDNWDCFKDKYIPV